MDSRIHYPLPLQDYWIGQTHREIEECFGGLGPEPVAIGRHPMDWPAGEWERAHPDTVIRRVCWSGGCSGGSCER